MQRAVSRAWEYAHIRNECFRALSSGAGNMALIKELRERSQAPISDVKAALVQSNWDLGERLATPPFHLTQ